MGGKQQSVQTSARYAVTVFWYLGNSSSNMLVSAGVAWTLITTAILLTILSFLGALRCFEVYKPWLQRKRDKEARSLLGDKCVCVVLSCPVIQWIFIGSRFDSIGRVCDRTVQPTA